MTPRPVEQIPSAPFARWLNEQLARLSGREHGDIQAAILSLAYECGWHGANDGGVRKLYRFRKQLRSSSLNGRKQDIPTVTFPRAPVEDALFCAGVPFEDVYPEIAAREQVLLEPAGWCPDCREERTPIDGLCPFCNWRLGPRTGQKLMGRVLNEKPRRRSA
jgi:hypothetical protein